MTYETVRYNFLRRLWNVLNVRMALTKGVISQPQFNSIMHEGVENEVITAEQYKTETGLDYVA